MQTVQYTDMLGMETKRRSGKVLASVYIRRTDKESAHNAQRIRRATSMTAT